MRGLAWLPLSVVFAIGACHVCDYAEVQGKSAIDVPEGTACPSPAEARALMGSNVLEVLGSAAPSSRVPGSEACCYDADVHEPVLDEEIDVEYRSPGPCDSVQSCGCVEAARLLGSLEGKTLEFVPEDATIAEVQSGPKYDDYARCAYRAHVRRAEATVTKHRCVTARFESGPAGTQYCPDASTLVGKASPLATASDEVIEKIDSGPVLGSTYLPQDECVYPVKTKKTSDVCG